MKLPFLDALDKRVLLGDGALGTYFYDKGIELGQDVELLNLSDPDLVFSIHQEYVRAGSDLIETNTFGANRFKLKDSYNVAEVNRAGVEIARRAAGQDIYVAGSVGPTGQYHPKNSVDITDAEVTEAFREQITVLVGAGVDLIIAETFTHLDELILAIKAAKEIAPELPLVAQMIFPSRGRTATGADALTCAEAALEAGASVFGSNCGRGVKAMLAAMERLSPLRNKIPLSAFPNAGLPEIVGHRTVYSANPSYMARGLVEMIKLGARLVGGCCGTTPEHIHEFKRILHLKKASIRMEAGEVPTASSTDDIDSGSQSKGGLLERLEPGRLPILVELDPPPHLDVEGVLKGAKALAAAGVDAITLAENPLAVLRSDNLSLAHLIRERTGVHTVLHLTCRDRNVLGLQAQVMAAHILGIRAILAITGDPANASDQPGVSGVFDMDSIGLVRMINLYNQGLNLAGRDMKQKTNFSIGVAFCFRPSNPELQIRRLEKKAAMGAHFVMTQPLFAPSQVEAMLEQTSPLNLTIFPGIFPLISARNAEFLHNEVPGISVPSEIREKLWKYEKVEDQRKAAMEITRKLVTEISSYVNGLYIISPLNKWEIPKKLVELIRGES